MSLPSPAPLFIARLILGGLSLFFLVLSSCGHEVTSQIFGQRRSEADSWHLISALDLAGTSGVELGEAEAAGAEGKAAGVLKAF